MAIVALLGGLLLSAYLVLKNVVTQHKILTEVTTQLSEKVHSRVDAGDVFWSFPNVFVFNDLYVEDQQQDTLLFVDRARVTVNILPLFSHRVSLRTVQLTGMKANVHNIDSTGVFNFQFLIDAFKTKDDSSKVQWTADFETVAFKDCAVSFHRDSVNATPDKINFAYLDISDLNGHIFIRNLDKDSVNVKLHKICFNEASGLSLTNLSTTVISNKHQISFDDFSTSLPHSTLAFDDAKIRYEDIKSKNFAHDFIFNVGFKKSSVRLSDLKAFLPSFALLDDDVKIDGSISGSVDNLSAKGFRVAMGNDFLLDADFNVKGLPHPESMFFDAIFRQVSVNADDVRRIGSSIINRQVFLPAQLDSLGVVTFVGKAVGKITDFKADGVLSSLPGDIDLDVSINSSDLNFNRYSINGAIETHDYRLGKVLGQKSRVGNTSFLLKVDLRCVDAISHNFNFDAVGQIDSFTYRDYPYKDISINGRFASNGFDGSLTIKDPNADLDFNGNIILSDVPQFHFNASLNTLNLARVNLFGDINDDPSLNCYMTADFVGKSFDDIEGSFSLDNIMYHKTAGKDLLVNNVNFNVVRDAKSNAKTATIYSDYFNGSLDGNYNISSLVSNVKSILAQYVPSIINDVEKKPGGNNFKFAFKLSNTEPLREVFGMPVSIIDEGSVTGFFDDVKSKFRVRAEVPLLQAGKLRFEDCILLCENPKDVAKVMLRMTNLPNNKRRNPFYLSLNSSAKHDSISSKLNFSNSSQVTYSGELDVLSVIKNRDSHGITADFFVNPTEFIIDDVKWNMHKSRICLNPDTLIVKNFLFDHDDQMLKIDGLCSKADQDSIVLSLRGIELNYISNIINANKFAFAGKAYGDVYINKVLSSPFFKAQLAIDSTALNTYLLGDLKVGAHFDVRDKSIFFAGDLASHLSRKESKLFGGVYLGRDSMDIVGDLQDIDLKFMRTYFGAVLEDFKGVANGHVRAYGKFGDFGLEGKPYASDVSFGIGLLNTEYFFSDTVYMTHNSFALRNVQAHDKFGNTAYTTGKVTHQGFKNFVYNIDMDCHNMLALNTTEADNETYYGTAFGDGSVNISGNMAQVNFKMNVKPTKGTKITIPVGGSADVDNLDFITFVENTDRLTASEKRRNRREKIKKIQEEKTVSTRVTFDMIMDVTPVAQIYIIMDPRQGDLIRATGNGNLRLTYDSQTADFGMLGNYELVKGDYQFSVQSIITRKFDIMEGSLLHWSGSPYSADLNVKAKYSLNASLVDILDDPTSNLNMANVDCLLFLTGTMQKPIIKFGIELPNADDEVKRKLASVLNTEEELNKNVASLLALGYFYTLDKNTSQQTSNTNGLSSVGFSTLSSEISSILSSIDNNLDVGLNYNPGSQEDATASEFEVNLSTQLLHDRLQLNGNFGYRDNVPNGANVSSGIMDFDIEYKMTKNGKLRLKGFNRSNNSYFKQTASQTQGVGFVYREDFDSYSEWVKGYYNSIRNVFGKKPTPHVAPAAADSSYVAPSRPDSLHGLK